MKKILSRRNVLRGAGVALSLPWLESLAPREARGQAATAIKRFIPVYFPNGAGVEWWDIKGEGKAWQICPLLRPLTPVKAKTVVIKNIGNYTWRRDLLTMNPSWFSSTVRQDLMTMMPAGSFNLPSHSRAPAAMLTCVDGDGVRRDRKLDVASAPVNAITADQVIAKAMPVKTPLQSMQLGLLDGPGDLDGRHSSMSRNMSWADADTPLGKDLDPQHVFDALVSNGATKQDSMTDPNAVAEAARRKVLDKSALDSITGSASTLQMRLAQGDKARLEQFLTGVRELETKIGQGAQPGRTAGCNPIARPTAVADPVAKSGIMNDLIVMALQCDVTRVISYMLDNSRSDLTYSHVKKHDFTKDVDVAGTAGGYHGSQHGGLRNNDFASITNWHVGNASDLAQKLDKVQEGNGTLLDNSLIMLFSDMHHGDHAGFDLPIALIGGGGVFQTDQYVVLPEDPQQARQMRDLYFTIMNNYLGLNIPSFGDDMRKIPNLPIKEILV
jgi:Protein of unknown function (DUF1552)